MKKASASKAAPGEPAPAPADEPAPTKKASPAQKTSPAKKAAAKKTAAKKTPAKKAQTSVGEAVPTKRPARKTTPAKKAATETPGATTPPATPAAKKAAPGKTAAKKAAPGKAAPEKAAPEKTAAKKAAPGKAAPGKAAPGKAAPGKTAPGKVAAPAEVRAEPAPGPAETATTPPPVEVEPVAPVATVVSGEVLPAQPVRSHRSNSDLVTTTPSLRDFRDRPMHAAEFLALAAVAHYGPGAATNIGWLREQYPNAAGEGIARAAAHRFVRQSRRRGAMAGLAGPVAVLLDAGTLHALHADLILHVAAAYGRDPSAPERAAELLFLLGVHDTAAEASTAVSSAIEPAAEGATGDPTRLGRPLARTLTVGVLRVGARRVLRLIPGAGALIGAVANARATEEMVTRALRFYRSG